ncbi:MAG: Zn-ribbon domain-containing OB-fold protein [Pseudomonadota bacterium]
MEYTLTFEQYQKGLEQGEFLGLHCNNCQTVTFPPLGTCRNCHGTDLKVTRIGGEGEIRTFTVIRVAPEGKKPPYVVAMVELEEGPSVIGNLLDINPGEANMGLIGKRVKLGSQVVAGDTYSPGDSRMITFSLM